MTPWLEKSLDGFHHRSVRRMEGMAPKNQQDGTRVYTPIGAALAMVGLEEISVYIAYCQNRVAQYIDTRLIMGLCLAADKKLGIRPSRRWWKQSNLDILGLRAWHAAAEGGGGAGAEELEGEGE